jgi:hypothetical protein
MMRISVPSLCQAKEVIAEHADSYPELLESSFLSACRQRAEQLVREPFIEEAINEVCAALQISEAKKLSAPSVKRIYAACIKREMETR